MGEQAEDSLDLPLSPNYPASREPFATETGNGRRVKSRNHAIPVRYSHHGPPTQIGVARCTLPCDLKGERQAVTRGQMYDCKT